MRVNLKNGLKNGSNDLSHFYLVVLIIAQYKVCIKDNLGKSAGKVEKFGNPKDDFYGIFHVFVSEWKKKKWKNRSAVWYLCVVTKRQKNMNDKQIKFSIVF